MLLGSIWESATSLCIDYTFLSIDCFCIYTKKWTLHIYYQYVNVLLEQTKL